MSDALERIEFCLADAVSRAGAPDAPPRVASAIRHAVFPGGARIRPRLCLAVAAACGDPHPMVSNAAASAIELLHCASLVHDDMPCFDDASLRRGRPSVHRLFGEPVALLAGDGLIVLGFETLARGASQAPHLLAPLVLILAGCSGMPNGIVGGQGWECEQRVDLATYQRAKTGALFAAATMAGAASAGAPAEPWRLFGERLGEAYQVADDIGDAVSTAGELGKPAGRDGVLGRPNAALQLGVPGALHRLEALVDEAIAVMPPCRNAALLRGLMLIEVQRLLPKKAVLRAA